jgi:hypothetical protein
MLSLDSQSSTEEKIIREGILAVQGLVLTHPKGNFSPTPHPQIPQDVAHVVSYCVNRNTQAPGDFCVGQTLGNQVGYFLLSGS